MKNHGFSLVEVMVSIGVMSVMSLALVTAIVQSQKSIKSLEMKLEQVNFATAFSNQISNSAACINTFSALRILPSALTVGSTINIPSDKISFQGALLSTYKFDSYSNVRINLKITSVPVAGSATGSLDVDLSLKSQFSNYLKPKSLGIPFALSVDAAGVITQCPNLLPEPPPPPPPNPPTFNPNNCYIIDDYLAQGNATTKTCIDGFGMLFATAFPDGSEDKVNNTRVNITSSSITVSAKKDSWRIFAKCCKLD